MGNETKKAQLNTGNSLINRTIMYVATSGQSNQDNSKREQQVHTRAAREVEGHNQTSTVLLLIANMV